MVGYLQLPDGKKVDVADGLVLGRMSSCGVLVRDAKASRRHAQLIVAGPVVEIEDLDSSNGTLLNDKPVRRRMLRDGDVVQIGATRITYHETRRDDRALDRVPDQPGPGEDLFADGPEPESQPESRPEPQPEPQPERQPEPQPEPRPVPQSRPQSKPQADEVLEFVDDEVVRVRKAPVAGRSGQISRVSATRTVVIPKRDRGTLPHARSGMSLGDDLRQMSLPMRLLGILLALAVAGAFGYLAYSLVS